ncbi:MAG: hypothetical protein ACTSRP_12075 [Candidatus Helarchaeota archaeon]
MEMPNPIGIIYDFIVSIFTISVILILVAIVIGLIGQKYKFVIIGSVGVILIIILNWLLINFFNVTLIDWWIFWRWLRFIYYDYSNTLYSVGEFII